MRVLLIGGTGVISADIAALLAERGHEVYLINRGNRPDLAPPEAVLLRADAYDEASVAAACQDLWFDCVANFIAYDLEDVERDFRLFHGKTGQYIFISSASAYQKPLSHCVITESTPLSNPFWEYSRKKIVCEDSLMWHYREEEFPITIVRPSHTYSSRNVPVSLHGKKGSWPVLQRMLEGKPIIVHGDGTSLWTMTHSRDFARAFAGLVGNVHAIGEAVHITSDELLTWNGIYNIIGAALGVKPLVQHVPSTFLAAAGHMAGYDFEGTLLGDKANSAIFDNSKIKRLVPGFAATVRFDQGMREAIAYLSARPELQYPEPDFDYFCDRVVAAMQQAQHTSTDPTIG